MDSRDSRLAAAAAVQHAVVTGATSGLHLTRRQLQLATDRGALERLHADVYAIAGAPTTQEQRLLAAVLAAGPHAAASHRAGAWVWEYEAFRRVFSLELTVELGRGPAPAGVIVHRTKRFDPVDLTVHRGIPVTTRERTLIDLGAVVPSFLVRTALDNYLRTGGSERRLRARLEAVSGRGCRGVGVLRAVLEGRDDGARPSGSIIELDFLDFCRRYGIEEPVAQHRIEFQDGSCFVVDWAWPHFRGVVELNGYEHHITRQAFESDHERRLVLRSLGYRCLEFTGRQLRDEGLMLRSLRAELPELFRSSDAWRGRI